MPEPEYDLPLNVKGETAIYVLARISGEGNDREAREGDIFLTESERRTILELKRQYRRFMLVLNVGGPVDLSPVMEVENILILSQLGVQTGSALADLVLGKTYPSGKSPFSIASRSFRNNSSEMCFLLSIVKDVSTLCSETGFDIFFIIFNGGLFWLSRGNSG